MRTVTLFTNADNFQHSVGRYLESLAIAAGLWITTPFRDRDTATSRLARINATHLRATRSDFPVSRKVLRPGPRPIANHGPALRRETRLWWDAIRRQARAGA